MTRSDIVAEARRWLGTPYCHQASAQGAGCDCLGLVRGIWRALVGPEPQTVMPYTPDWAEARGDELLLGAAEAHFIRCAGAARPGDVLVFRMAPGVPAKHCAVLSQPDAIIHAYWGRSVAESRLAPWWMQRVAAAYSFPGLED